MVETREDFTTIPISIEIRDVLKAAILQAQAKLGRELTYDEWLRWVLKEQGFIRK